jgi:hypothetical protein
MPIERFIAKNLKIDIYISKTDIDATDTINIYDFTDDPSAMVGTQIIDNIKSIEVDDDPSITGDAYLFTHTQVVFTPGTYLYYYTIVDSSGNESDPVTDFEHSVCLVPVAPDSLPFSFLVFGENSSGQADLSGNTLFQLKMNDDAPNPAVVDFEGNISPSYVGENTEDRTVAGKINTALNFVRSNTDYITTNVNLSGAFRSSFSFNVWIKPVDATPAITRYIYGVTDGGNNICAFAYATAGIHFIYRAGGVVSNPNEVFSNALTDNNWHMVTLTMDEVTTNIVEVKCYVDNVEMTGSSGLIAYDMDVYTNAQDVYIGAINNAGTDDFYHDGAMDDFRMFDKVLTAQERFYLWSSGAGTEENVDDFSEFQTVFHFPEGEVGNPSALVEDGDYNIDSTNIGVEDAGEEVEYFRTYTDANCDLESGQSGAGSPPESTTSTNTNSFNLPSSDPQNIFIKTAPDGGFLLSWNYDRENNDPIVGFNIYYALVLNPSALDNPSVIEYIFDGTLSWNGMTNVYAYLTNTLFDDGVEVDWKVLPYSVSGDRDNDDIQTETADQTAPTVTTDFITTTLI